MSRDFNLNPNECSPSYCVHWCKRSSYLYFPHLALRHSKRVIANIKVRPQPLKLPVAISKLLSLKRWLNYNSIFSLACFHCEQTPNRKENIKSTGALGPANNYVIRTCPYIYTFTYKRPSQIKPFSLSLTHFLTHPLTLSFSCIHTFLFRFPYREERLK